MKLFIKMRYLKLHTPIIIGLFFVTIFMFTINHGYAVVADSVNTRTEKYSQDEDIIGSTETTTGTIYLPILMKNYPWISPFGIEANRSLTDGSLLLNRAVELKSNWVRMNGRISWRELQPTEGGPIDWTIMGSFENELMALKTKGMTPIVVIDDHPYWAVKPFLKNGEETYTSCAAVKTEKLGAYADFIRQVVKRYSAPKYSVHHWELGNEPDVDPGIVPANSIYGCWGDIDDPFYGGRHYGEMLKVVTPAIKAADPQARVWIGGLLLDIPNNTNPTYGKPEKFLAGILESGAATYFDVVAYHAYTGYNGVIQDQDNGKTSHWSDWGGIVSGKAKYLRQVLTQYRVDKPIFLNEFALNCPECNPLTDEFLEMQADQLVRSITRGLSNQIMGFTWYTLDGLGWRNGGLLDANQEPRLAFVAYQNLAIMLDTTKYLSSRYYGDGVEAYRFSRGTTEIDVLWAIDNQVLTVSFPTDDFIEARTRDGVLLPVPPLVNGNYQLTVDFSPIYIVYER